jgi:hypothetical protein
MRVPPFSAVVLYTHLENNHLGEEDLPWHRSVLLV